MRRLEVTGVECRVATRVFTQAVRDVPADPWTCDGHSGRWIDWRYYLNLACWQDGGPYALGVLYEWPANLLPLGRRLTIVANRSGLVSLGGFRPRRDARRARVDAAFGFPAREREGGTCKLRWPDLGLRVDMANFGLGDRCNDGFAQRAVIAGPAGRRRWRTERGLRVGDSLARLRRLYPAASRHGRSWWVVPGRFIGYRIGIVSAIVSGGRVTALKVWIGGAGD